MNQETRSTDADAASVIPFAALSFSGPVVAAAGLTMAACKLDDAVRFLPDDLHAKAQEVARSPQIAEVPTQALVPSGQL